MTRAAKRKLSLPEDLPAHNTSRSRASSTASFEASPPPPYNHQNDQDLVSAAEVLTQLTKNPTPSPGSEALSVGRPLLAQSVEVPDAAPEGEHPLVTRVAQVSKHPIVTNAYKYYESLKRSYAPFNYAAEIVEKAAIPVVNKIELNLNSRHRARQLKEEDKLNKKRRLDRTRSSGSVHSHRDSETVSLETKKRLQFCLHILKLANEHINTKVVFLQQKMEGKEKEIKEREESRPAAGDPEASTNAVADPEAPKDAIADPEATQKTKTEIISTVKKIIHVISNFKPSSLSADYNEDAETESSEKKSDAAVEGKIAQENMQLKSTIRDIILNLPNSIQQTSAAAAPNCKSNDRIFVFAKESLDMIGRLTYVFNEQLEKAEQWVAGEEDGMAPVAADDAFLDSDTTMLEDKQTSDVSQKLVGDNKFQV